MQVKNQFTEMLVEKLFDLISVDEPNEDEIVKILNDDENKDVIKEVINTIPDNDLEESMLMWAVWRLKKNVIIELLKLGVDYDYANNSSESASTYWNFENDASEKEQILVGEIAEILDKAGVDLDADGMYSWSLVTKAHKYKLKKLISKLQELGY